MGGRGGELEMSWQPSLLSQKRKSGPPLGLKNLGNSCYLNSVLQCLTYTPPLANFCLRFQHSSLCDSTLNNGDKKRECPFCILEKRIASSLRSDGTLDAPQKILNCLRTYAEHFRFGRQEDAHEFLRYVIDACHNTCLRLKKLRRSNKCDGEGGGGSGDTVVKEIFGGALQSQVKCSLCNSESNKVDEIMDISLDVLTCNSLKDAMQKFFQPEILDGSNKYKCENCKKLVAARKQMSIRQAPNILVIQLKRFEGIFGGKIDKAIAFEEALALSSFMSKGSQDPHPQYKLFGIIVHSGFSAETGHYFAYIKDAAGRWYCCNDSFVSVSSLQEVLSEKAYILFFSRTNKKGVPAGTSCASNGAKSLNLSNHEPSRIPKPSHPPNGVIPMKHSLRKEMPLSNGEKAPSSPQLKFHVNGNSGSKKAPLTINGKVDIHRTNGVKADAKQSDQMEKPVKDLSLAKNMNGFHKQKDVTSSDAKTDTSFKSVRENGVSHPVTPNLHDNNGTSSRKVGIGSNKNESQNGVDSSNVSGSKRKPREDTCILLAQDDHSRAKIEELKQSLKTDTLSHLRSSDWYETVLSFMRSEKRQRTVGAESTQSTDILKRRLVEAAKTTFVSRIPVSVKQNLVKRLQSFIKEK